MISRRVLLAAALLATSPMAVSQEVRDFSGTIELFRQIPQVTPYFDSAYGYAVWQTIGRGGIGIGGATGLGQVYGGRLLAGALWFLGTMFCYGAVLLPGFLVHALCVWSAFDGARRWRSWSF